MTDTDALDVHKLGNSSTLKTSASGAFQVGQQEQRVVSLQFLNESSQIADPQKRQHLWVGNCFNVFGSR
jgi:hypothetical protein